MHPTTVNFTMRLCFPDTSDKAASRKQTASSLCILSLLPGQIQTICLDTCHSWRTALVWHHRAVTDGPGGRLKWGPEGGALRVG